MSQPRKESRTGVRPLLMVSAFVLALAVGTAVSFSLLESVRFTEQWKPQVTFTVPGRGSFEYGWVPQHGLFDGPFGRGDSTYLLWDRSDGTRRYRIHEGGDPLGRAIRIHLANRGEGLWIENARDGQFLAALQFEPERFWDINLLPGFNDDTGSTVQRRPQWSTHTTSRQIYPASIESAPSQ